MRLEQDTEYFIPSVGIEDYNVLIDGQKFFDKPIKKNKRTCNDILKITTGQGDDYKTVVYYLIPI